MSVCMQRWIDFNRSISTKFAKNTRRTFEDVSNPISFERYPHPLGRFVRIRDQEVQVRKYVPVSVTGYLNVYDRNN